MRVTGTLWRWRRAIVVDKNTKAWAPSKEDVLWRVQEGGSEIGPPTSDDGSDIDVQLGIDSPFQYATDDTKTKVMQALMALPLSSQANLLWISAYFIPLMSCRFWPLYEDICWSWSTKLHTTPSTSPSPLPCTCSMTHNPTHPEIKPSGSTPSPNSSRSKTTFLTFLACPSRSAKSPQISLIFRLLDAGSLTCCEAWVYRGFAYSARFALSQQQLHQRHICDYVGLSSQLWCVMANILKTTNLPSVCSCQLQHMSQSQAVLLSCSSAGWFSTRNCHEKTDQKWNQCWFIEELLAGCSIMALMQHLAWWLDLNHLVHFICRCNPCLQFDFVN